MARDRSATVLNRGRLVTGAPVGTASRENCGARLGAASKPCHLKRLTVTATEGGIATGTPRRTA